MRALLNKKHHRKYMEDMKMDDKNYLEKLLIANKYVKCECCGGKLYYVDSGRYKCHSCGNETLDDFGKVKAFLDQCGSAPASVVAQATGVSPEIIEYFLKKGRVEIPEGSKYYLKCERCSCSIRYGRFCVECARELAGSLQAMFNEDIGERPKYEQNPDMAGRMRHFTKGIWFT